MAQETKPDKESKEDVLDIDLVKQRLDMLDRRLDNIDSMITVVAERVMNQPITFEIICPHCGKNIEIAIIGNQKPTK
ncbi:MAG TPA: hypothetical protein G4N93_03160 [Dehalococcoidia bacterium]|nr:hypothetical protein [Dehalococcoidia bacterium]